MRKGEIDVQFFDDYNDKSKEQRSDNDNWTLFLACLLFCCKKVLSIIDDEKVRNRCLIL